MGNPIPYFPANSADNTRRDAHDAHQGNRQRRVTEGGTVPNSDWKFCYGAAARSPRRARRPALPVQHLPDERTAFEPEQALPARLQGEGPVRARRRHRGVPRRAVLLPLRGRRTTSARANPLAGSIRWAIIRGSSQSGNFTRHFIFLGMNQDESGPHRARRRLAAHRRPARRQQLALGPARRRARALPDGQRRPAMVDDVRRTRCAICPTRGILDRCKRTDTCPKIDRDLRRRRSVRAEDDDLLGRHRCEEGHPAAQQRAPLLPAELDARRRQRRLQRSHRPDARVSCPGNNWGTRHARANPVPATQLVNRMRVALRDWVMNGTPPPPSQWPTLEPSRARDQGTTMTTMTDDDHDGKGHGARARGMTTMGTAPLGTSAAARRAEHAGHGIPERRSGHSGLDLPAGELHLPGVRLRLGPATTTTARRTACRPTRRRRSGT